MTQLSSEYFSIVSSQYPALVLPSVSVGKCGQLSGFTRSNSIPPPLALRLGSSSMRCLYCGARLPLLRELQNGDYCSDAHREAWERAQHACASEESKFATLPRRHIPTSARIRLYPLRHMVINAPGPRMVETGGVPLVCPDVRSIRFRGEPASSRMPAVPKASVSFLANWEVRKGAGKALVLGLLVGFLYVLRWGMPDLNVPPVLNANFGGYVRQRLGRFPENRVATGGGRPERRFSQWSRRLGERPQRPRLGLRRSWLRRCRRTSRFTAPALSSPTIVWSFSGRSKRGEWDGPCGRPTPIITRQCGWWSPDPGLFRWWI